MTNCQTFLAIAACEDGLGSLGRAADPADTSSSRSSQLDCPSNRGKVSLKSCINEMSRLLKLGKREGFIRKAKCNTSGPQRMLFLATIGAERDGNGDVMWARRPDVPLSRQEQYVRTTGRS